MNVRVYVTAQSMYTYMRVLTQSLMLPNMYMHVRACAYIPRKLLVHVNKQAHTLSGMHVHCGGVAPKSCTCACVVAVTRTWHVTVIIIMYACMIEHTHMSW